MASERMTIGEHLTKAIKERDPRRTEAMVDLLRFRHGLKYDDIYAMAHRLTGISVTDWEDRMYEIDMMEQDTVRMEEYRDE